MRAALLAVALAATAVAVAAQPDPPPGLTRWSFDEITLVNGSKLQGLILRELPDGGFEFRSVSRLPGRPTVTLTSYPSKAEIAKVVRLSDQDRQVLRARLDELDPTGEGERRRMESLELVPADWPQKPGAAKLYDSDYFTLVSTGAEELTRRSAVRLEQIYTAFARFLPPTVKDARPTRIMLATDPAEYRAILGGAKVLNPAVYDATTNQVLCGSDLTRLGDELQRARLHHAQQLEGLDRYEAGVRRLYKGDELVRHLKMVAADRRRIYAADANNGLKFDTATGKLLFAMLYHESFHAYVSTFVYPPLKPDRVRAGAGPGELPRWLNEGLAQVFETAVVEAGELRADHPDRERLVRAQDWLRGRPGGPLVPLPDLLTTGREMFLASHSDQKAATDRAYLTCWALAYYLTFERRLIGTARFREYLVAVNGGGDPRKAFADLVGQELGAFERDWHRYLTKLQPDGSLAK